MPQERNQSPDGFRTYPRTDPRTWKKYADHLHAASLVIFDAQLRLISGTRDSKSEELMRRIEDELAGGGVSKETLKEWHRTGIQFSALVANPLHNGPSGFMLFGLALEVLMKAIWICQHPERKGTIPAKWNGSAGHNLVALSELIGLGWKREWRDQLSDLSDHIRWVGRYPAPLVPSTKKSIRFHMKTCEEIHKELLSVFELRLKDYEGKMLDRSSP